MVDFLANPINVLLILGVAALLTGVIGGNVEAKGIKVPPLTLAQRMCVGVAGALLVGSGVGIHLRTAPKPAVKAIDETKTSLKEEEAAEHALREQIGRLEAERVRLERAAGEEQAARLKALEQELAVKREEKTHAAEQVASTRAVLDQKEDALRESERVVRAYYEALNRRDFEAAKARYLNPGPKLAKSFGWIDSPDSFTINKIKSEEIAPDASYVVVHTDIDARGGKERWRGTIQVSKSGDTWKISRMDLANAPLNLARRDPEPR